MVLVLWLILPDGYVFSKRTIGLFSVFRPLSFYECSFVLIEPLPDTLQSSLKKGKNEC